MLTSPLPQSPAGESTWIATLATALAFGLSLPAGAHAQVTLADRQSLEAAAPTQAAAPKQPRSLLIFQKTSGWTPPQRALVDTAMRILGRKTGAWKVDSISEDPAVMAPQSLARFDAILMNNCNELTLSESQSKALQDFVKAGKGVLGVGSTISIRNWPEEAEMWSGFCYRHPTHGFIPLRNEDPSHTLTKMFSPQGISLNDTWYTIYSPTNWSRSKARVLLSWDWPVNGAPATDDKAYPWIKTGDYPISYIRKYGNGRVYFNAFMHLQPTSIFDKAVLVHLVAVTQWALGDVELSAQETAPGPDFVARPYTGPTKADPAGLAAVLTRIKGGDAGAVIELAKYMPDPKAATVFPDILKLLMTTSNWYDAQDAAMGLGRMGASAQAIVPLITAKLNDPNPVVRGKLLYAFEEMGPASASAIPAMQAALKDTDWLVRQAAAEALGNTGPAGFAACLEMLKSPAWFTRFQGVQGLGRNAVAAGEIPAASQALTALLNDPDPEVVNAVKRAMLALGVTAVLRPNPGKSGSGSSRPDVRGWLPATAQGADPVWRMGRMPGLFDPRGRLVGETR